MANYCEHFPGRLPTEIQQEIDRLPVGFLDEVLEAKYYRQAYHMTQEADTAEAIQRLPKTPLFAMVKAITLALAGEEIEERRRTE